MSATPEIRDEDSLCEVCPCATPNSPTFFYVNCCSWYCAVDWDLQGPHKPGKAVGGRKHDKVNKDVYQRLHPLPEPPKNREELTKLHQDDHENIWFGVSEADRRGFCDYGRFSDLMANSQPGGGEVQYPQLVSFIGQTSKASYSALISMTDSFLPTLEKARWLNCSSHTERRAQP